MYESTAMRERQGPATPAPASRTDFIIVWRYRARPDAIAAFEQAYRPDGAWARLFRRHEGYRDTELVRADEPRAYLTIDRWASREAFEAFLEAARDEYDRLDAECEALTEFEELVSRGVVVSGRP